jgi:hypothetical protein
MLLEALQQISKSRDDKFFSEHFSYITKDFDPSQPSQYSAQSLKDYMDWLAGLNQDKILQSNIDQLKNKCENGQENDIVNLQDFLDNSNFESNLLRDINNYFKDSLFMAGILKNTSTPESPQPSPPATALVPATALSTPPTPQNKAENIINLLREFNSLKNPQPESIRINYLGSHTIVYTQNLTFLLKQDSQEVFQQKNQIGIVYPTFGKNSLIGNYDVFIKLLNEEINNERVRKASVPLQPTQPVYNAHTTYSFSGGNPFQTYGPASPYGVQPWQPTLHQPAMPYGSQPWQLTSQPRSCLPNATPLTFPTIHGSLITYPSNFLHTVPGSSSNPYEQVYQAPFSTSALPYVVGGGAMGTGYWSRQVYGGQLTTIQSQPMSYMSSIIPGTAVYGAYSGTGSTSWSNSLGPPR